MLPFVFTRVLELISELGCKADMKTAYIVFCVRLTMQKKASPTCG